ncbi:hypothetical protein Aph01nite_78640 [Acrocarpospora phusangensis]|uniref:Uncharacterized protein n=1 Tax=Acrocarpospora phusangensis TaxID=1070424 RepID=A0A919UQ88_9ACTN|nr:hypothetical protein Aph01nite_78640 [Acrocarpospora phusangensis]
MNDGSRREALPNLTVQPARLPGFLPGVDADAGLSASSKRVGGRENHGAHGPERRTTELKRLREPKRNADVGA